MHTIPDSAAEPADCFGAHHAKAWALAIILALMGAFFWAIRGSAGFGGSGGGMLAGLGWAMLWMLFCDLDGRAAHRPYGRLRVIPAITLGIALGGLTGYGAYISWIQGRFYLEYPHDPREIGMWTGYLALFMCGLHWGGNAGAFLAWCAPAKPMTRRAWGARIGAGLAGAAAALTIVTVLPQWFLPFHSEGIYSGSERVVRSLRNIAPHVGLFLGFLAFEWARGDRRAVSVMLIPALGFALAFSVGGYWHTFHGHPLGLDWWKHWEMTIGIGGGLSLALVFLRHNRADGPGGYPPSSPGEPGWVAFTMWLVTGSVVANTWKGFAQLHELDWPEHFRIALTLVYLVGAAIWIVSWLRSGAVLFPRRLMASTLGLLVVSGYLVSVPSSYAVALWVLVALYSGCILVSAAGYGTILRRCGDHSRPV